MRYMIPTARRYPVLLGPSEGLGNPMMPMMINGQLGLTNDEVVENFLENQKYSLILQGLTTAVMAALAIVSFVKLAASR